MIRLLPGDCREVLATLPADSVHTVVTSPPYYALRDYNVAGQLGLEATPEAYLAEMVRVFREVRRVLRPDGTCWVNMGSSYSNGKGSNVTDQLNRLLEGGSVFFANAGPRGVAGHGVGVTLHDERAPDGELSGFLAAQRDGVEQRHQDFCQVADLFAGPGSAGPRPASTSVLGHMPDTEVVSGECEHGPVIAPGHDTQAETILAVLRSSGAGAGEDDETALAIHQADEPCIRGNVRWHTAWHTFASNAIRKGSEDVHLVDQAIALGNRPQTLAGLLCDFHVAKATEQKVMLTSIQGGLTLTISDVGQLWFVLRCGSVVPYSRLYADASRFANALLPKQDLGMPWQLARALQEDGWILRSPIIWHKPNPMPESVTDRPTSAHEHVFLLAKNARYYFDSDAVRESAQDWTTGGPGIGIRETHHYGAGNGGNAGLKGIAQRYKDGTAPTSRNLRNVWTIPTTPFSGWTETSRQVRVPPGSGLVGMRLRTTSPNCPAHAEIARASEGCIDDGPPSERIGSHSAGNASSDDLSHCTCEWYIEKTEKTSHFATFPPALAERCIRAGTSERGCCATCGAPWGRVVERTVVPLQATNNPAMRDAGVRTTMPRCNVDATTIGWAASCACGADTVPCTVLDPFAGAGTTLLVADRLQRDAIGIELNPDYTEMAMARCRDDAPLFVSPPPAEDPEDTRIRDLFSEAAQ